MTQATPHQRDLAGESWDPGQYLKFADHRLRPALDLMGRIPLERPQVIYDLGCGSGNVTRLLSDRWPGASVIGMDNSPEMLRQAASVERGSARQRELGARRPGRLATQPDSVGLFLQRRDPMGARPPRACAAPVEHAAFPALAWRSRRRSAWDMRSHQIMRETLENGGHGGQAVGSAELRSAVGNRWVQDPDFYYDLLAPEARPPGRLDHGIPARPHRRRRRARMGYRHRPAPHPQRPRRRRPRNLPGRVSAKAQRRVPETSRRVHPVSIPASIFRRRTAVAGRPPGRTVSDAGTANYPQPHSYITPLEVQT